MNKDLMQEAYRLRALRDARDEYAGSADDMMALIDWLMIELEATPEVKP